MDVTTNNTVRKHGVQTNEWVFSKLSNELYTWFDRFNGWFFDLQLKTPVISFERRSVNSLGHFVLHRNALGLKWNININRLYIDLPLIDTLSTLLHEMIHQWQQEFGEYSLASIRNNYHNIEFRLKAQIMGIPSNEYGAGVGYTDPFVSFLKEYGVDFESSLFSGEVPIKIRKRGRSKLKKWSCGCTNVRVAIDDFKAKCLRCGNEFELKDL